MSPRALAPPESGGAAFPRAGRHEFMLVQSDGNRRRRRWPRAAGHGRGRPRRRRHAAARRDERRHRDLSVRRPTRRRSSAMRMPRSIAPRPRPRHHLLYEAGGQAPARAARDPAAAAHRRSERRARPVPRRRPRSAARSWLRGAGALESSDPRPDLAGTSFRSRKRGPHPADRQWVLVKRVAREAASCGPLHIAVNLSPPVPPRRSCGLIHSVLLDTGLRRAA